MSIVKNGSGKKSRVRMAKKHRYKLQSYKQKKYSIVKNIPVCTCCSIISASLNMPIPL